MKKIILMALPLLILAGCKKPSEDVEKVDTLEQLSQEQTEEFLTEVKDMSWENKTIKSNLSASVSVMMMNMEYKIVGTTCYKDENNIYTNQTITRPSETMMGGVQTTKVVENYFVKDGLSYDYEETTTDGVSEKLLTVQTLTEKSSPIESIPEGTFDFASFVSMVSNDISGTKLGGTVVLVYEIKEDSQINANLKTLIEEEGILEDSFGDVIITGKINFTFVDSSLTTIQTTGLNISTSLEGTPLLIPIRARVDITDGIEVEPKEPTDASSYTLTTFPAIGEYINEENFSVLSIGSDMIATYNSNVYDVSSRDFITYTLKSDTETIEFNLKNSKIKKDGVETDLKKIYYPYIWNGAYEDKSGNKVIEIVYSSFSYKDQTYNYKSREGNLILFENTNDSNDISIIYFTEEDLSRACLAENGTKIDLYFKNNVVI